MLLLILLVQGCTDIASYDQAAYANATSLKVDALDLVGKATSSFSAHTEDIRQLGLKLDKAYEYDKGRNKNEITVHQWDILRDSNRELLGGFFKEWKESGHLLPAYVADKQIQISRAFDTIIGLESGKLKPSDVSGSH